MNWINNFAQLKYYEELAGLIIFGIIFAGYLVYFGILYLRDFLKSRRKKQPILKSKIAIIADFRRYKLMNKRIKPKWQIEKERARKNAKGSINTNASHTFKSLVDALSKISNIGKKLKNKWSDVEQQAKTLIVNDTQSEINVLEKNQKDIEQQLNDLNMRLRQLELGLKSW